MKKRIVYAAIPILCIICTIYIYIINNSNDNDIITGYGGHGFIAEDAGVEALIPEDGDRQTVITIIHTCDLHGRFDPDDGLLGMATVAAVKKETGNALLVDAGDSFWGSNFSSLCKGRDVHKIMEAAGYDVAVPGNHHLDYGDNHFIELMDESKLNFISANIYKDETLILPPRIIKEVDGVKIGFVGLIVNSMYHYPYSGLTFKDNRDAARIQVDLLKQEGADVIIALTHIDEVRAEILAEAVPEIDVIIFAHGHIDWWPDDSTHNGVVMATAYEHGKRLGFITVTLDADNKIMDIHSKTMEAEDVKEIYRPDEAIQEMVGEVWDKVNTAITREKGDDYLRHYDTMDGGSVAVRVTADSRRVSKHSMFSGYVTGETVDRIREIFTEKYDNKMQFIHFNQHTDFASAIHVAAKVDLTGMDTENLVFYGYRPFSQALLDIENPEYSIDEEGFLRFTTRYGGAIIISEGPLIEK